MAHTPRHDEILHIISRLRSVSVQELTDRLKVSEVTIRKDLSILEEMGAIVRTHGGAKLAEDRTMLRTLETRMREHADEKRAIAEKAKELINEGDTIYIDSGSTCYYLATRIREMSLRIVTNSIDVIVALADAPGISLFSIGGNYRKEAGSFLGPVAIEGVRNFRFESCFMGATGVSKDGSFSSQNVFESQLKRQVLQSSSRRVVLVDSSKLNASAFSVFAHPREVDVIIVDAGFGGAVGLSNLGVEVIIAAPEQPEP